MSLCADTACRCHVDPEHRVMKPFPLTDGPPYCCNRCARPGYRVIYDPRFLPPTRLRNE